MKKAKIKFSHSYEKMVGIDLTAPTTLLHVFVEDTNNFGELFVSYDTLIKLPDDITIHSEEEMQGVEFYKLPKGKVLVLLLMTINRLWTTIRRWTPEKERYYRSHVGKDVEIIIND